MAAKKKEIETFKTRFSDALWFEESKSRLVLLLGVGGIGSWVMFSLCRIGFPLLVFDMDNIESHNLGGQLYGRSHIGKEKTQTMLEICREFCGDENEITLDTAYTKDSLSNPIVIAAFDNMTSRKLAYEKWMDLLKEDDEHKEDYIFIDGRLLAEDYQVYAVTYKNAEKYRETLFDDKAVPDAPCSFKATTHCSMGIASEIVSVLTNFVANRVAIRDYGTEIREVPFSIIKSIPLYEYRLQSNES